MIFALVPYANELQGWISRRLGARALRWMLLAALAAGVVAAATWLFARRREGGRWPPGLPWIVAIATLLGAWGWNLRVAAEPAHLIAFAVLSALAFRALLPYHGDHGVYLAAAALTAIVGTLDEVLQWLTPGRFWDLGDVAINATTGVLVQLLIWKGIRPRAVAPGIGRRSLRIGLRLVAAEVLLLLLCLSNTPPRIEWYAARVPGLSYLGQSRSTRMTEFGHLYRDPEIGRFRSRLAPEELARVDRERAAEAAALLDRYRRPNRYGDFLAEISPGRDPFVYEARTRLHYRNRLWTRARNAEDPVERARLATLAYRENRILERYFPHTLNRSRVALQPPARRRMESLHLPQLAFESEVSDWLVTGVSEVQARWGLLAVLAGLILADRRCAVGDRG